MLNCRIILSVGDGLKVWINPLHIIKMVKNQKGQYYIHLVNGDTFEISYREAKNIEAFFEERTKID